MAAEVTVTVNAQDNFSGVLGNFGNIMTGVNSLVNLAGDAFRAFGDFAMQGLESIAGYERMSATMETLVAKELLLAGGAESMADALGLAGPKAEELLGWIQEIAINSPFTSEGVAAAFRTALAYGFTADEAQRLTEAMINFASGSGASEQTMNQIALALGQIEAKGKLAGQEVLQLVNAGLPVTQILAEAFGVTTAEIEKMREDGLIPAQAAIEAITVYLEENFAGAAERQATTWAGLKGTFEDIKQIGLREFFGGMFDVLQPLAVELSNFLQTEGMDRLREMGDVLANFTTDFISLVAEIQEVGIENFDWGQLFEDALIAGIDSIDWNAIGLSFNEAMQQGFTFETSGPLSQSIGNALTDLISGGFGYTDWDVLARDVAAGFEYALVAAFGYMRFEDLATDFVNGFRYIGQQIAAAFGYYGWDAWNQLWSDFQAGWNYTLSRIKSLLGIQSPSTVFSNIARDLVQGLINGWNSLFDNFLDAVSGGIEDILALFAPILALFGFDVPTGGGGGTGGGTRPPDDRAPRSPGDGTGDTGGEGGIVYNFYGDVYFGEAGTPGADGSYVCLPTQIDVGGLGGGGTGGGSVGGRPGRPR